MCKSWSTPQELGSVVSRSIVKLIKDKPGVGWVRADSVPTESAAQEILRLRDHITNLERKIAETALNPPTGTEDLAKGEETVKLTFSHRTRSARDGQVDYPFTWNRLLTILGPLLLKSATDHALQAKLKTKSLVTKLETLAGVPTVFDVRDEDFHRVTFQFRALGLIRVRTRVDAEGRGAFIGSSLPTATLS